MRHLMPIVTPRLVLRPPILDDLDAIQAAKEDAWNLVQTEYAAEQPSSRDSIDLAGISADRLNLIPRVALFRSGRELWIISASDAGRRWSRAAVRLSCGGLPRF